MLESRRMQDNRSVGKDWAKAILANGYEADKRNPSVTTAKVWNKKTKKFKTITIKAGDNLMNKMNWRGDMIR